MSVVKIDRSSDQRCDELSSLSDVARTFGSNGSPRVIVAALLAAVVIRLAIGGFGWFDLVIVVATVLLAGPIEWVIHRFLLHAPEDSRRMTRFATGSGHRRHHLDPQDVGWVLLSWADATIFIVGLALWSALWSIPLALGFSAPVLASYASAFVLAIAGLAHYEWTHLLVHTRYRPRTRFYRRLAANHRLHHYRNEKFWLGVTSNLGDRVLGTLPADKSDVALSSTARKLDG